MTEEERKMHEKALESYACAFEFIRDKKDMKDMKLNTVFHMAKTVANFMKEMWERNISLLAG